MSKLLLEQCLVFAVCLLLPSAAAANSLPKTETLTIFVKGSTPEGVDSLRDEVARLMEPAGFVVEWKTMADRKVGVSYERLVTVEFKGSCKASLALAPSGYPDPDVRSLASSAVADGRVLPFATVQCDSLRRAMWSPLASVRQEERRDVFGRAAGRVLAHELFHMLARTKEHSTDGASKACFGVADLTREQFEFDGVTLGQMRPSAPIYEEMDAFDTVSR